ncbi:MAG: SulP family inorganic anion transporter [Streptosporangiaceae bacterium]
MQSAGEAERGLVIRGDRRAGVGAAFTIPAVRLSDLGPLFAGALGIALVSLADTISTASAFAARTGQEVRGNGEMIGIGAANLAAGLFQGFPVSTSGSRTAVAERSGAKTQLTGVTGAVLIILMIVLVPGLFRNLPQPALAAVVITASLSLADIPATVRLWRQRKAEFLLSIAAFLGVALLGVLPGIAIAVALSILNVFPRHHARPAMMTFLDVMTGRLRHALLRGLERTGEPDRRLGGSRAAPAWPPGIPLRSDQEVRRR